MHPQLICFVICCRQSEIKPPVRSLVAGTLLRAVEIPGSENLDASIYSKILNREFVEALKQYDFRPELAKEADLLQSEERYEDINQAIAVCIYVAAAPTEIMSSMTRVFTSQDHWKIWEYLKKLNAETLEAIYSRYSPFGKGNSHNWDSQHSTMEEITRSSAARAR